MEDKILKVEGLIKRYDSFSLNGISFSIPRGYIMGFVGRNGAGKSTTIKCIMNLIGYDAGKIEIFGLDSGKHIDDIKNRIGYVSEEQYFYEEMTVEWTGNFISSFYDKWDSAYYIELLSKFNIDKSKKVKELSRGMKVKLSLALAMSHKPEFLILDEPTSGLDPVVRSELLDVFRDIIQDERCSIFFSSHITSDIEKVADFVTIIDSGKIILSEEKDIVMEKWVVVKTDRSCCDSEINSRLLGLKRGEFGISGVTSDLDGFSRAFRKGFPNGHFKTEKINLDELLLRLVKDGDNAC